jgi:hypothetical protein
MIFQHVSNLLIRIRIRIGIKNGNSDPDPDWYHNYADP